MQGKNIFKFPFEKEAFVMIENDYYSGRFSTTKFCCENENLEYGDAD